MNNTSRYTRKLTVLTILLASLLAGCASSSRQFTTMMSAPVIYHASDIDPFAHLEESQKVTEARIFYATNRQPTERINETTYGNSVDRDIHLGVAAIQMGSPEHSWNDLYRYSRGEDSIVRMPIVLGEVEQIASLKEEGLAPGTKGLPDDLQQFINAINQELADAADKEIMVYIHGAKVDFDNSAILTAEIDHFAGRDFVGVAFAWPSHQNILAYLAGIDVRHANASNDALQSLLKLLAEYTDAEHINILAYSAGGKVSTRALHGLRQTYSELTAEQLKSKFRIGAVALAAIDVEVDQFIERLPSISDMAQQVAITVTDSDYALEAAKKYMGGMARVGSGEAKAIEEAFITDHHLANIEIIDVSLGHELRGFDIGGHHYWYRHPWMSSDIIFLMRTDLPPAARGLTAAQMQGVWYFSPNYPEKIREAVKTSLGDRWSAAEVPE